MSATPPDNKSPDPLVDEIRAIRHKISERFDHDVDKLCDHLQQLEREHPDRLVEPEGQTGQSHAAT